MRVPPQNIDRLIGLYNVKRLLQVKSLMSSTATSIFDIVEKDYTGKDIRLGDAFRGHVTYGINVASEWGKTKAGYALLSTLSKVDGVKVAIFPCNQFGSQEPGTDEEIYQFALSKGVNPSNAVVFAKADVNGPATRETYKAVKAATGMGEIAWNFGGQFIIDREGQVKLCANMTKAEAMVKELL